MESRCIELHTQGVMTQIGQGEATTLRFEDANPLSPVVMMLSLNALGLDDDENIIMKKFGNVKISVNIEYEDKNLLYNGELES